MRDPSLRILVLGSAAGGGFPQWNCACENCRLAWSGDRRVLPRSQSSIAVTGDGETWALVNASPDLRQQILKAPDLRPRGSGRDSPIRAVVLTNGDIDHIAGLLVMRERQALDIFATAAVQSAVRANAVFGVLDPGLVRWHVLEPGQVAAPVPGVSVEAFAVPGKVPLYAEGETVTIGLESGETIGLEIRGHGRRVLHVPGCAVVTEALKGRVGGCDALLFDGTCYRDDEMVRLGLSSKTAARMGHVAMAGPDGSIAAFDGVAAGRKVFIHINNTNPVLLAGSEERLAIDAAGWDLAFDGMALTWDNRTCAT